MRLALLLVLVPLAPPLAAQELGEDLVIETERGALGTTKEAARLEVQLDTSMPVGETPISIRVLGASVQDVAEVRVTIDGKEVTRLTSPPFDLPHDFGKTPAAHSIVAEARLASGGWIKGSRVTPAPSPMMLETAVAEVEVSVIVKDAQGNRVRDLKREEFTVLEDGVPQPIQSFSTERAPLSLVMVLDSSGSMEGRMWSLKKSAIDFIDKMDADVPIQIVDFDHEVRLEQEFTLERAKVKAAVNRLAEGGGTHLWDAAYSGAFALTGKDTRRAVVLFTDGVDQSGEDDEERIVSGLDEVIETARQEEVQFYCIGFGRKIDEETLGRLSSETGGVSYVAESTKEFRAVYDAILADVAAQYLLGYAPTNTRRDGAFRKIEVRLARPGLEASYRRGYVADKE